MTRYTTARNKAMNARRPTRKAVQASLAAQAPMDWQPPAKATTRRAKPADEPVPDLAPQDGEEGGE